MSRVVHFDIVADKPDRASRFYGSVFGWKFRKWDGPMNYWMIDTGKDGQGINGGMGLKSESKMPNMNTIDVKDIEKSIEKIKTNGGKLVGKKQPIPGVGWFASFKDTEGNLFGLMQDDKSAK